MAVYRKRERKLSMTLLFISTLPLFATLTGVYRHENARIRTVALKVSPQGHVSGRSPQSSGSLRRSSGSRLRVVATVLRIKSQVEVLRVMSQVDKRYSGLWSSVLRVRSQSRGLAASLARSLAQPDPYAGGSGCARLLSTLGD